MANTARTAEEVDQTSPEEVERLTRAATYAAVGTASILVLIKLTAWLYTGSVALLGSLFDSILDVVASIVNLVAVRQALMPRDQEHRFGHGKAEALAGLAQSFVIVLSSFYLGYQCYLHFIHPEPVPNGSLGIIVVVIAIAMTFVLVRFQRYVIERSGSIAISADHLHYTGDLMMNVGVIFAIFLSSFAKAPWADPIIGVGIAVYILFAAWKIARQSYDQLMDREFPDEKRNRVKTIALEHPKVLDVHDVRTRSAGVFNFIQLHLELDPLMPLMEAHNIADEVEAALKQAFPRSEVIIHQDPAGLEELTALDQE